MYKTFFVTLIMSLSTLHAQADVNLTWQCNHCDMDACETLDEINRPALPANVAQLAVCILAAAEAADIVKPRLPNEALERLRANLEVKRFELPIAGYDPPEESAPEIGTTEFTSDFHVVVEGDTCRIEKPEISKLSRRFQACQDGRIIDAWISTSPPPPDTVGN